LVGELRFRLGLLAEVELVLVQNYELVREFPPSVYIEYGRIRGFRSHSSAAGAVDSERDAPFSLRPVSAASPPVRFAQRLALHNLISYQEEGTSLDLVKNDRDILGDDSQDEGLDESGNAQKSGIGGPAWNREVGEQPDADGHGAHEKQHQAAEERQKAGVAQGDLRKRDESRAGQAKQAAHADLALSVGAVGPLVFHEGLLPTHPGPQAGEKTAAFGHGLQEVHDHPIHEAEGPGLLGYRGIGEFPQNKIKKGGRPAHHVPLVSGNPQSIDHIGALAPLLVELRNELRRVLEVSVHHHHSGALREKDAGAQGGHVPEVTKQADDSQLRDAAAQVNELRQRVVPAAVVDDHHLEGLAERSTSFREAPEQLGDNHGLVEKRCHHG